jgi:hypothetical protein
VEHGILLDLISSKIVPRRKCAIVIFWNAEQT